MRILVYADHMFEIQIEQIISSQGDSENERKTPCFSTHETWALPQYQSGNQADKLSLTGNG